MASRSPPQVGAERFRNRYGRSQAVLFACSRTRYRLGCDSRSQAPSASLALFGRRPPCRVVSSSMPASENLHINRHNRQLFDDLGGAQQNRRRYRKTERLGGFEVHGHLELGRELHREIARLLAAQNAIHIGGGATNGVSHGSVGEQTAVSDRVRSVVDRRYVVSGRRRYDGARCTSVNASPGTTRPLPGSRPKAMMAVSISASL